MSTIYRPIVAQSDKQCITVGCSNSFCEYLHPDQKPPLVATTAANVRYRVDAVRSSLANAERRMRHIMKAKNSTKSIKQEVAEILATFASLTQELEVASHLATSLGASEP